MAEQNQELPRQLSKHIEGKYKLASHLFPGRYNVPGFGPVDFRTITKAQADALYKFRGEKTLIPVKQKETSGKSGNASSSK